MVDCHEDGKNDMIRIVNCGVSYSFVPAPNKPIVVKCKVKCGFVGEWKVEQHQWETSISRG